MGKSDLLKDGMKSGLDGLLSEKRNGSGQGGKGTGGTLQFRHRQKRAYPHEIPGHRKEHVSP